MKNLVLFLFIIVQFVLADTITLNNDLTSELDESIPGQNDYTMEYEPVPLFGDNDTRGTETMGSWTSVYTGSTRARGNIYYVDTETVLTEHHLYLYIPTSTSLYFMVYESESLSNNFELISSVYKAESDTGERWYSSGSINVPLEVGKYYALLTSWSGTAS